jgi:cytochrome P450
VATTETADDYDPFEAFDRAQGSEAGLDPYPRFRELLEQCPVHQGGSQLIRDDALDVSAFTDPDAQPYTVFSYDAVERVLRDHETFSSTGYAKSMGLVMGHTILEMDEPEHRAYRSLIAQAFTRSEMERWERDWIRPVVHEHIDAFAGRGHADLVKELTFSFPNTVMARAMDLPEEGREQFYRWSVEITNMSAEPERGFAASQALYDYFQELITPRRARAGDDLISLLAHAELDGQTLTDDEIIAFLRLLLPAGSETTYRSSSNLLYGLLSHPDQLDALRADRALMAQAIEEGLRWEAPLTGIGRTASRDVDIDGVTIPAGSPVAVCLGAANRDPSRWDDPEEFDILRDRRQHIAFATGNHMCLGMHLARIETEVMLEAVLDRLPNLRLDPNRTDLEIVGIMFRSPRSLPVLFDV